MGGELLGCQLHSGQLDVCKVHAYSEHPKRDPHQVSIFVLAYTQADVKSEIFVELPIFFKVERDHPR